MIGSKGVPARHGGVERVVEELGARLGARGHEVLVYTRPYYTGEPAPEYRGMTLKSLPSIQTKHLDTITHTFLSVLHTILRFRPDVAHVHSLGNAPLVLLLKLAGIPTILHIHGLEWKMDKWGALAKAYFRLCEKALPRFPDRIVTVAEVWTQDLMGRIPGLRVRTLHNGVNPGEPADPGELRRHGLSPDGYVVFVGRLAPQKGGHLLIEAFRRLPSEQKLVLVGGPDDTESYHRSLVRMAAGDPRIVFAGFQYGAALSSLLGHSRVYVHPSVSEGLSLSLLEAMAAGRPILASDIPENREALGASGRYFRSEDAESLRHELSELLSDPGRPELGKAARSRARDLFDWDRIAGELVRLYEEVARRGASPQAA